MKRIPLNVLDAYANRLTEKQVNMLYESKCNKKYVKPLCESLHKHTKYDLYLDEYVMASELNANKAEVIMHLNKQYPELMESITYCIDDDSIDFSTKNSENLNKLTEALLTMGVSCETLHEMRSKNYM